MSLCLLYIHTNTLLSLRHHYRHLRAGAFGESRFSSYTQHQPHIYTVSTMYAETARMPPDTIINMLYSFMVLRFYRGLVRTALQSALQRPSVDKGHRRGMWRGLRTFWMRMFRCPFVRIEQVDSYKKV